jgi:hypothetical protein
MIKQVRSTVLRELLTESLENLRTIKQYLVGRRKLSQSEMAKISPNFTYSLSHAILMQIPVDKIVGLDPEPSSWVDDKGDNRQYSKGENIKEPIEVQYDEDQNQFDLMNGNHRIKQAKLNGDSTILAFVELPRPFMYDSILRPY